MKDSLKPESYLDLETAIRRLQKGQKEPLAFLGKVGVGISEEKLKKDDFQSYDLVFLRLDEEGYLRRKNGDFSQNRNAYRSVSAEGTMRHRSITGNFWSTYGNGALRSPDFPGRSR